MAKALAPLKTKTSREYVLLKKRVVRLLRPQRTAVSVFLSGVHRSGTNSIMAVLERSLDTDVFMEADSRAFDDYIMRDGETIRRLITSSRARCVVIKALHEAHDLNRLMEGFAPARTIWVFRHYADVVNSILSHWPGLRNRLEEIVLHHGEGEWRGKGMSADTRAMLEEHYRPDMNDASANALFWLYRNQLFFDQGLPENPAAYMVRYESIVAQPQPYVRELADVLGIRCNPAMIKVLHAGSVKRAAPPPIDEDVQALCEEMLGRLNAAWERQQARRRGAPDILNPGTRRQGAGP